MCINLGKTFALCPYINALKNILMGADVHGKKPIYMYAV